MPDLLDGESVKVQGSASRPYQIKNVAGIYSCSCPAWRNQSLPIDVRTCKHIRGLRGDTAEKERVGTVLPSRTTKINGVLRAPPLLLAETWTDDIDPASWLLSEKLDGVRAFFDGKQFLSRTGHRYFAPHWFTAGLPLEPLDGELWIGRKKFQRTVSIVGRQDASELWNEVRFVVFDAPGEDGPFEQRLKLIETIMAVNNPPFMVAHPHITCNGRAHLKEELARIESLGGEGLMLRRPGSTYAAGRSSTLLKVKRFLDDEARVVGYEPGAGRHRGRVGALLLEMPNGIRFAVGTGLSDSERMNPPPAGSTIQFRFQELTDAGVPRFPSYVGIREDSSNSHTPLKGDELMAAIQSAPRRFEYVGGGSDKFWLIEVNGTEVTVRFGRNGTQGQVNSKSFSDERAAQKHAEKLIAQKLGKGYVEVP